MRSRRPLSVLVVLPILIVTALTVIGGFTASSILSGSRLRSDAEHRAIDQLAALETVANVSDITGLRRAATTTGASRDVDLVFIAAGNPAVVIASSHTELVGKPVTELDGEVRQAAGAHDESSKGRLITHFNDRLLTASAALQVREATRDGTDLSGAFGVVQIDFSGVATEAANDAFLLTLGEIAAVLLLAGVAVWLLRRHVLKPLQAVAEVVADPENSSEDHSASVEIHRLATTLRSALIAHAEAEAQLAEANEQLRELVDSKDRFMASVSHELRTPLASILGFAGYLQDPDMDLSEEDRVAFVETISREGEDVMDLIEDLLTSAQADIGRLDETQVNVGLLAQARQVVEGLVGRAADIAVRGNPVSVAGVPRRVRQIVRNLLTNAARYGGPNVHVAVIARAEAGCLQVVDDGPGVDDADRELIFEAFERARDGVRNTDSIGVGLPVARTLARLMGGDLQYRREGGMTVFELTLPLLFDESESVEATGRAATEDAASVVR